MKRRNFFEKVQKLNDFQKKVLIIGIILLLAVPFSFFIWKNFQKNLETAKERDILKNLDVQQKIGEETKAIKKELKKIEEKIPTSTAE